MSAAKKRSAAASADAPTSDSAAKPAEAAAAPAAAAAGKAKKPFKGVLNVGDLMIPMLFNGFFITNALLDVSKDLYYTQTGQYGLLASHYQWKEVTPVIVYINLFCTFVLLPVGLWNGCKEGYLQLITHSAPLKRHLIDFVSITSLWVLVALNFGHVLAFEHDFSTRWAAPWDIGGGKHAAAAAQHMLHCHYAVLGLNVLLAFLPLFKLNEPTDPDAVSSAVKQQPKKDD